MKTSILQVFYAKTAVRWSFDHAHNEAKSYWKN